MARSKARSAKQSEPASGTRKPPSITEATLLVAVSALIVAVLFGVVTLCIEISHGARQTDKPPPQAVVGVPESKTSINPFYVAEEERRQLRDTDHEPTDPPRDSGVGSDLPANSPLFRNVQFHTTLVIQPVCPPMAVLHVCFEAHVQNDTSSRMVWVPGVVEYPGLGQVEFWIGETGAQPSQQLLEDVIENGKRIGVTAPARILSAGAELMYRAYWQLLVRDGNRRELCVARRVAPPVVIGCTLRKGDDSAEYHVRLVGSGIHAMNAQSDNYRWQWVQTPTQVAPMAVLVWEREEGESPGLPGDCIRGSRLRESVQGSAGERVGAGDRRNPDGTAKPVHGFECEYAWSWDRDTVKSPFRSGACISAVSVG